MEFFGRGDSEGGCQWVCWTKDGGGACVAMSGGYDYGSWIEFAAEIDEDDYQQLQQWDKLSYDDQHRLLAAFILKYGCQPPRLNPQKGIR